MKPTEQEAWSTERREGMVSRGKPSDATLIEEVGLGTTV